MKNFIGIDFAKEKFDVAFITAYAACGLSSRPPLSPTPPFLSSPWARMQCRNIPDQESPQTRASGP